MKIERIEQIFSDELPYQDCFYYPSSSYLLSQEKSQLKFILTARDNHNRSRLFKITYNLESKQIKINGPLIELGINPSVFDSNGTSYPIYLRKENKEFIFYTGWASHEVNPFKNSLAVAVFEEGIMAQHNISILDKAKYISEIGSSEIMEYGDAYYLFFTEFLEWQQESPRYKISVAKGYDLLTWKKDYSFNLDIIDQLSSKLVCRPSIIFRDNLFYMFFCHRNEDSDYKLGLVSSKNFLDWHLVDQDIFKACYLPTWCEIGQSYPHITYDEHNKIFRLFFAGNSYGKDGFGYAEFSKLR